jgi:ankyrin repeat protein
LDVGKGLPTYGWEAMVTVGRFLAACVWLALAGPACAFDPERDAWLLPPDAELQPAGARRAIDPIEFARIRATGNDQEPVYALADQLALIEAASAGDRPKLEELLKQGVNPNGKPDLRGKTALMHAVERGDAEMTRLLLEAGADPDLKAGGYTPLCKAAIMGHGRIAKMLLKHGADPDLKSIDGNTPLFLAAWLDRVEVVRALLAGGADMRLTSRGFSEPMPFDMLVLTERPHFANFDLKIHDYNGLTAPGVAALENNVASLGLMLEAGADPNFRDRGRLTPIFYAIYRRHRPAIDLLLAHGADPGVLRTDF